MTPDQVRAQWDAEADALPRETRQRYLDLLKSGKTLGEAREEAGISFGAAMSITNAAISQNKHYSISFEAKP